MSLRHSTALVLAALFPGVACWDAPFVGTRCADEQVLEYCTATGEDYQGYVCYRYECPPGICVEENGKASCSTCDRPARDTRYCHEGNMYVCKAGTTFSDPIECDGVCVTAGGEAMCATSATPWPGCDPEKPVQKICLSDSTSGECRYGYRPAAIHSSAPYPSSWGIPSTSEGHCSAGWSCVDNGLISSCVPNPIVFSMACPPDVLGVKVCEGSTQLSCALGRVVENVKCRTCDGETCTGRVWDACSSDDECAHGLRCLPSKANPKGWCTLPCTGPTERNEQCLAAEVDTSMNYNLIYGKCYNGFCGFTEI